MPQADVSLVDHVGAWSLLLEDDRVNGAGGEIGGFHSDFLELFVLSHLILELLHFSFPQGLDIIKRADLVGLLFFQFDGGSVGIPFRDILKVGKVSPDFLERSWDVGCETQFDHC